jgi:flagellar hook-length control protein FliK
LTDVASLAGTEAAATGAPNREEQKLDSALASSLSALFTQVAAIASQAKEAATTDPNVPDTEAAKNPSVTTPKTKSDLASVATTPAGIPAIKEKQPLETSVREASTVPPSNGEAPDSPLLFSKTEALTTIAERFAQEVASRLANTSSREKASSERAPSKTEAAENLPPALERLLERVPSEVRQLITTLRQISHRMLRDGTSFSDVAAAFRAALKSTVRYAHSSEMATQLRSRPDVASAVTEAATPAWSATEVAANDVAHTFNKRGDRVPPTSPSAIGDLATTAAADAEAAPPLTTVRSALREILPPITDVRTLHFREISQARLTKPIGDPGDGDAIKAAPKTTAADAHAAPFAVRDLPSGSYPDTVAKASTEARFAEVASKLFEQASELAAQGGRRTLAVRLDPPELGTVDITIHSRGAKVEAQIVASSPEVRFAVEGNRQALTEALARHGLELSSLSVGSERSGGGAHRYTEAAFQPPAYRFAPEAALTEAVSRSAARWAWQVGALDYII